MLDYTVNLITSRDSLESASRRLERAAAIALDIETVNWWDREAERVSLIQLAFRDAGATEVLVIDALAGFDLEALRRPLELSLATKAIHNAAFDAVKLARHLRISTSPIHDTMLAARRSGERKCSLQAQVETHLGIELDKSEQRGDWSRRPLSREQLNYAALDAACTLLLFEKQIERGLHGDYELRQPATPPRVLPRQPRLADFDKPAPSDSGLTNTALALLGIVAELNGRYSPEQLAVSVGRERIGLAGWIVDRWLSGDQDVDQETARQEIAGLCERGLIILSPSRRLEITPPGAKLWREKNTKP